MYLIVDMWSRFHVALPQIWSAEAIATFLYLVVIPVIFHVIILTPIIKDHVRSSAPRLSVNVVISVKRNVMKSVNLVKSWCLSHCHVLTLPSFLVQRMLEAMSVQRSVSRLCHVVINVVVCVMNLADHAL